MKLRFTLTLIILTLINSFLFAQTKVILNTKPKWNIKADGWNPKRLDLFAKLADNKIAIAVNYPKSDFGIVLLNQNTEQLWLTGLHGDPIALDYFSGKIYVVAASKKDPTGLKAKKYTVFILDPTTGQKLNEKIIYEFNSGYREESEFHFGANGSQFSLISKAIESKDSVKLISNYSVITFDNQLNLLKILTPTFKSNNILFSKIGKDGKLMIATLNKDIISFTLQDVLSGQIFGNVELQLKSNLIPTNTQVLSIYNHTSKNYYISVTYEDLSKNKKLLVGTIDFKTNKIAINEEDINEKYFKELAKNHKPINKKIDDYFISSKYPTLLDLKIIDNKLVVELTGQYEIIYNDLNIGLIANNSVLIKVYSGDLKLSFQSIFPRYITTYREGVKLFYHLNNNILSVIGNTNKNYKFIPIIQKIDFTTGKTISLEKINSNISDKFFIISQAVESLDNNRIFIPYAERAASLRVKKSIILQILQL